MPKNIDPIATKQMEQIWKEHHSPEKGKRLDLQKRREKRRIVKIKDYGI